MQNDRSRIRLIGIVTGLALLVLGATAVQAEPDYPHGEFEAECSLCHGPEQWSPAQIDPDFDHGELAEFELEGSHRRALCRSCHLSLEFQKAEPDCASCHQDVHNGELGPDCSTCHSTTNFIDRADELRSHRMTRFPLTGAHGGLDCRSCHQPQPQGGMQFVNTPVDCVACHRQDFQATTVPNHVALGFDEDCTRCHGTAAWDTARFDHDASGFPLSGAHATLTCESCHAGGQYSSTPAQCFSCHQTDYEATTNPDHGAAGFPTECQQCHATTSWDGAAFNHDLTGFTLDGGHTALECQSCHTGGNYNATDAQCASCHQADYQQAPNHVSGNYPTDCQSCHTTATWQGAQFQHDFFALTGGHDAVECTQCHTSGSFGTIPSDCVSCHQGDYVTAPSHAASNFPQTCESCHTIQTWSGANYDHGFFPLTGAHNGVNCVDCHTSGTYAVIPSNCVDCHQSDYQQAPGHVASNFPTTCDSCHSTNTWSGITIDHSTFPLTGGHATPTCIDCHTTGVYAAMPSDCINCHQGDYVTAPSHAASNFPQTCETCHNTSTFVGGTYDHGFFPLTGAHNGVNCVDCHTSGTYAVIPSNCVDCHQSDYQQAPGHVASNFPTTCDSCHSTNTWTGVTVDHSAFPLTGAHATPTCIDCHTTGVYATIPNDCINCHQGDYATAPSHAASNFPQTCEDCHNTSTFVGGTFDHGFFPLTGAHNGVNCVDCHTSGTYAVIPSNCVDCHQSDYQQAPGHVASNFPTTCDSCHSPNSWTGVTIDHSAFPLTGGHATPTCIDCHTTGVYATIPNDCINCHQGDYATAPSHAASNFPQTCENCHTTSTFVGGTFDHSFFPLSGAHNGLNCVACHTSGIYQIIPSNCIDCHQTNYNQAPSHASAGFPTTCDDCHTLNTWTGATFDHATFPITGAHVPLTCQQCHTSGTYGPMPDDCIFCHQADYTTAPGHVSSNFPQTCESCHTTSTFVGGTFDHNSFPLNGGHNGLECVDCHTSGSYGTIPSNCFACHQADYQQAPDHASLQFPTDCEQCHDVTIWQNDNFNHSFPTTGPHDRNCTDCHVTGTTAEFSCYGTCHEHNQSEVNQDHSEVNGYVYDFQACLNCHPNGRD